MICFKKTAILALIIFLLSLNSCKKDSEEKSEKVDQRPNIVLIMADDMGYSDLGCYGSEIHTPNLDKLAGEGLRYTQFYNTSRCCPTRASLLTGLYPHQTGLGWMTRLDLGKPGYTGQLNDQCVTLGEVLKQAGYSTYISGKWHVNKDDECEQDSPKHNWPLHRGFDRFFGMLKGATDYFKPENLYTDDKKIEPGKDFYFTDEINDHASQFIKDHVTLNKKNPFFLYVAEVAPHWPLHAKPEDIAKYQGKYMEGWTKTRQKRYERMLKLGVIPSNTKLSKPEDRVLDWNSLSEEQKIDMDKRMAVFAAQVHAMDQGIGRIVKTLEEQGQLENTLIIFLSDNGSSSLSVSRKSKKPEDLGTQKSFESYGVSWTNVSNTPMRYYKLYEHEGGVSTPLIVHWPKG
ncbi:MAG: arylsulfatase, partial [Flavobacteriia bacterium]